MVRQFGIKRLLFLRGYLRTIIGCVFQSGSFQNVDLDNDGKVDGFKFHLKNPVFSGYYKRFELEVNGEKIPAHDIEIKINSQTIKAGQVSFQTPICFIPGQPSEIIVHKPMGLVAGKHKIKLTVQLRDVASIYLSGETEFKLSGRSNASTLCL